MRLVMGVLLALAVTAAGAAMAGEECPHAKKKMEEKKECPRAKKMAEKKGCPFAKDKAEACGECGKIMAEARALRKAGAKIEIEGTKRGHDVLVTADEADLVKKIRAASASQVAFLKKLSLKPEEAPCEHCASVAKAIAAGDITIKRSEIRQGVKMAYAGKTDEARKLLKACHCVNWRMPGKDKAGCPMKTDKKS